MKKNIPVTTLPQQEKPAVLTPPISILIKMGSIAVHVEELLSKDGHEFDKVALDSLLSDPEVKEWMAEMSKLALLPLKRSGK